MKMYWVFLVSDSTGLPVVPLMKLVPTEDCKVYHDLWEAITVALFDLDWDSNEPTYHNLTCGVARRILAVTQFEEGEESKDNLNCLRDLMEIFPDLIQEFGVDYRPTDVIPEDYYA